MCFLSKSDLRIYSVRKYKELNHFKPRKKRQYLPHYRIDKDLKGTAVNLPFLHVGSLEHTLTQGTNARKVISEVYAFFILSLLSLGGNVNTRRMSKPEMGSIFTKIINEIFQSKKTIM